MLINSLCEAQILVIIDRNPGNFFACGWMETSGCLVIGIIRAKNIEFNYFHIIKFPLF
jgi:hypothetical protein